MSPETFLGLSLIKLTPDALTIVYPGTYTFTLERTGFQDDEGKDMQRMAING